MIKDAKENKKMYRLVIHNPKFRNDKGECVCWLNGEKYVVKEGEPMEMNDSLISYFTNSRKIETLPTGQDNGVDIEQGFRRKVSKNFDLLEV